MTVSYLAMKLSLGHKNLNLEHLFKISLKIKRLSQDNNL